jgi:hypothetical protein
MIEIFLMGLICQIGSGGSIIRAALIADPAHHAIIKTPRRPELEFKLPTVLHPSTHTITFELAANPNDEFKKGPATTNPNFDRVPRLRSITNGTIRSVVERGDADWAVIAYVKFPVGFIETAQSYPEKAIYTMGGQLRYEGCVAKRTRFYSNINERVNIYIDGGDGAGGNQPFDYVDPGEQVEINNVRKKDDMEYSQGDFARHNRLLDTNSSVLILPEKHPCTEHFYCDNNPDCQHLFEFDKLVMKDGFKFFDVHPKNDTSVECSNSHWP